MPTIGERLLTMKRYSELSLAQIAELAGYRGASSIQKLFNKDYNPEKLPKDVANKLAAALVGKGNPPIRSEELSALTGDASELEQVFAELNHYAHLMHEFISLFHTERFGDSIITEQGHEVPLFRRKDNDNGLHYSAPKHIRHKRIVALYTSVGTMWPRYEEGEVLFYEHGQPPAQGDDVLVTVVSEAHLEGGMIVGRLYLLHESEVQLDILSPRDRIVIPRSCVISIHRLLTRSDMLDPPLTVL